MNSTTSRARSWPLSRVSTCSHDLVHIQRLEANPKLGELRDDGFYGRGAPARVDVVYGSSPHLLAAFAAWMIAAVRRVPFVLEIRDLWPRVLVDMGQLRESSIAYRLLTALELFLYARASRIVVMAPGCGSNLVERGIPSQRSPTSPTRGP